MTTATIRANVRGLRPVDHHEREMVRDYPVPRAPGHMRLAWLGILSALLGTWWALYGLLCLVWR